MTRIPNTLFITGAALVCALQIATAQTRVTRTQFNATLHAPRYQMVGETFQASVTIGVPTQRHPNGNGTVRIYQTWSLGGDPQATNFLEKQYDFLESKDVSGSVVLSPAVEYFSQGRRDLITQRHAAFTCVSAGQSTLHYEGTVTYQYHDVRPGQFSFQVPRMTGSTYLLDVRSVTCIEPSTAVPADTTYRPDGTVQLDVSLPTHRYDVGATIPLRGTVKHTLAGPVRALQAIVIPDGSIVKTRGFLNEIYPDPQKAWQLSAGQSATFQTGHAFTCAAEGMGSLEVKVQAHTGSFFGNTDLQRVKINVICQHRPLAVDLANQPGPTRQSLEPLRLDTPPTLEGR